MRLTVASRHDKTGDGPSLSTTTEEGERNETSNMVHCRIIYRGNLDVGRLFRRQKRRGWDSQTKSSLAAHGSGANCPGVEVE